MFARSVITATRALAPAAKTQSSAAVASQVATFIGQNLDSFKPTIDTINNDMSAQNSAPCVTWGPRVPLEVDPETYETDLKDFWEDEWDEWLEVDEMWRQAEKVLHKTLPPDCVDQVTVPADKYNWNVSPMTEKFFAKWMAEGEEGQRILMPLCGGVCYEMAFFSGIGHQVVGVEYIRSAIDTMNSQDILPSFAEVGWRQNFLIHHSKASGAVVAEGDWFKATPEELGTFDKAWDRCGLTSVPKEKIPQYAKVLASLMKSGGKVLFETQTASADADGTPNDTYSWCSPDAVKAAFGDDFKVELLETNDVDGIFPYDKSDVKGLQTHMFLMTRN